MKKKIQLSDLMVKSFVIEKKTLNSDTVKGGRPISYGGTCPSVSCEDYTMCCSKGTPWCDSNGNYDTVIC